ncbi:internalin [Bifidobacterium ramosum]|uniref:Internalin n=1 Tax=Bifidobacterium ramosum TaxID=1798158 RepID=A0A6L4X1F9_9BIFI|nr:S-layer homology domain-containing protein [Bifidobacterium ramosum]KAB8288598.1 internalin [Bifidobacterium ramosum]NEG71801.1 hypothetical protein [Bifidobacterium ramosum]
MQMQSIRSFLAGSVAAALMTTGGMFVHVGDAFAQDIDEPASAGQVMSQKGTLADTDAVSRPNSAMLRAETDDSDTANGSEDDRVSSLGVTLGSGIPVVVNETLNQSDVYKKALAQIIKWRKDALADKAIKFWYEGAYIPLPDYLNQIGMSEEEYLSPKWSTALERIAVQRAVESADVSLGHTRPNDESCFTATYNGDSASSEILAWGSKDVAEAINLWASEKKAYIAQVEGKDHGVTGHYITLISPAYDRYGFGQATGVEYRYTYAGEAASSDTLQDSSDEPTNLTGKKDVEVALSQDRFQQNTLSMPASLIVGNTFQASLQLKYLSGRYHFAGTWSSSDPSVISIDNSGKGVAKKEGSVTITASTYNNELSQTVGVRAFADVTSKTPHTEDISWLASTGISTGWTRKDGTREFRGGQSVTRQDMAAFLYRLAGSPDFDASKAKNPFKDVTKKTPHYREILWLASTGISTGWKERNGSYTFRGMDTVKRQDMAAFLHRLADYAQAMPTLGSTISFRDVTSKTAHADDIDWLARTGVTEGWTEKDGSRTFRGMTSVKRQDMAAFLHRMSVNVLA